MSDVARFRPLKVEHADRHTADHDADGQAGRVATCVGFTGSRLIQLDRKSVPERLLAFLKGAKNPA